MLSSYCLSKVDLDRAGVMDRLVERRMTIGEAAQVMGLSPRHTARLLSAYKAEGLSALQSKKRGQKSNRAYPPSYKHYVLDLVRTHYFDFGPTFAAEKLTHCHNIRVSKETLRQWMIEDGLWVPRAQRKRIQQLRPRRERFGELVQIDGSHHRWFEDRAAPCALLVFIDDATGRLLELYFCQSETTFDYMIATQRYLSRYGKPLAFYSDKHTVFRSANPTYYGATNQTQFGRALYELNIDIICANSPQAKGRVERANLTLQDRLVKELRLADISDIDGANAFVETYIETHNRKFARQAPNAHRSLSSHDSLDHAFCLKHTRTVSRQLSLQYDKKRFNLEVSDWTKRLAGRTITVCDYPDGRLVLEYEGVSIPYKVFDMLQHVERPDIVENKRLSAVLTHIQDLQQKRAQDGHDQRRLKPGRLKADAAQTHEPVKNLEPQGPQLSPLPAEDHSGFDHTPGQTRAKIDPRSLNPSQAYIRKVSKVLTLTHKGIRYRLNPPAQTALHGEKVWLYEIASDWIEILYKGTALAYSAKRVYHLRSRDDARSEVRSKVGE